jgi:hypothetical protein
VGESFPPDNQGRIHGVGLDTRAGSGGSKGPYRVIADQDLGASRARVGDAANSTQAQWFDNLSYCRSREDDSDALTTEGNVWVSVEAWTRSFQRLREIAEGLGASNTGTPGQPLRKSAVTRILRVRALVDAAGGRITTVSRTQSPPAEGAVSGYTLSVRDAAGAEVANVPMLAEIVEDSDELPLVADVPSDVDAAELVLLRGTEVVAAMRRSAPPQVAVTIPQRGPLGRGPRTVVTWRTTDPDSSSRQASVDYSHDGGRTWRPLFSGADRGRAAVPSAALARSTSGRLRVRIDDGFSETASVTPSMRTLGAGPRVEITSPSSGQRILNQAAVLLAGEAFDDAGRRLRGSRLVWFDGTRRLGTGESISTAGLPAGLRRIRLVATDRFGRRSAAVVPVRLLAAVPRLLVLRAPARVGTRARVVRLRVATTVPTVLRIGRRLFQVDRRERTIVVPIAPGRGLLRLGLRLGGPRAPEIRVPIRR